uniref:Predicted nuclease of the RNAse H fold, HicB family n=1 Tax=Candidatus Kentrum sp. MB TaxID=2138164 RepID=A0A451B8M5_9GAMM|nr:MAG: Predicted nuclease of the RNAse H fold, HicB family [Candidatus Kentron sp. MB]VFK74648.1 MAG: Predicted nuclease of the RNAse H fold, HicB family [Candidatus Kentron sp. MB]
MHPKNNIPTSSSGTVEIKTMRYTVVLESSEEGYAASVPGLPGCHSQGNTEQEALKNISDAIYEYLEAVRELTNHRIVREIEVGV